MSDPKLTFPCHFCSKQIQHPSEQIGFQDTCPHCHEYLHSCKFCKHLDQTAQKCTSRSAERPSQLDNKNYCEEFQINPINTSSKKKDSSQEAKDKLNKLFKF